MEAINHECYVSLEVAKLLKEAGFDWYNCSYRYNDALKLSRNIPGRTYGGDYYCIAPTLDVAQRWLREVKNLSIEIYSTKNFALQNWYHYKIVDKLGNEITSRDFNLYTYEEAQEAGIMKALEIILKKGV